MSDPPSAGTEHSRQLHATGDRIRGAAMARRWHERPGIGPALKWFNRHLPW